MVFDANIGLTFDDVLLRPNFSTVRSRRDVDLSVQLTRNLRLKLPIIASNMPSVVDVEMAIRLFSVGGIAMYPRVYSESKRWNAFKVLRDSDVGVLPTFGINEIDFLERCLDHFDFPVVVIDLAHAHQQRVIDEVSLLRDKWLDVDFIVGNIATSDAAYQFCQRGLVNLKVGIGSGSICTTRIVAGAGVPQLSAILETAEVVRQYGGEFGSVLADGGITTSGDMVKALAAGASAVILGNLLAGTDASPGFVEMTERGLMKRYAGLTSVDVKGDAQFVEGVSGYVPFVGGLEDVVSRYCDGLRSGFSYVGAKDIEELWSGAVFRRITPSSYARSGSHNLY